MSRDLSNELSRMGRRRFLNTLAGLGVSASALGYLSQDALADLTDDPTEEVPRLERVTHTNHEAVASGEEPPEREPEFYTIPRDEWAQVEAAQDAMRGLDARLRRLTDSELVSVSVGTTVSGGHRQRAVFVTYASEDGTTPDVDFRSVKDAVPATVSGTAGEGEDAVTVEEIPVVVERGTAGDDSCDVFDHEYRDPGLPGGCMIAPGCCTAATPAYDDDEDEYQLTAAGHCYDAYDTVYQPSTAGDGIGYVDERSDRQYFDASKIDLYNGDHDTTYEFASDAGDDSYRSVPIIGILGWDQIKDGVDSVYLNKQGATTSISGGYVRRIHENSSDPNARMFEIEADRDGGDSGGPHYRHYYDSIGQTAVVAGIHKGWVSSSDYAAATAMEAVEAEFNLTV